MKRFKKLVALTLSFLMVFLMLPEEAMVALAADYTVGVGETIEISGDQSGDNYSIYASGGVATLNVVNGGTIAQVDVSSNGILNIAEGGTVTVVDLSGDGEVTSSGSIGTLTAQYGNVVLNGGTVSSLNINSTFPTVEVNGLVQADSVFSPIQFDGAGTLIVSDELVMGSSTPSSVTIQVEADTIISTYLEIDVVCGGNTYTIPAETTELSVNDLYSYTMSANEVSFDAVYPSYSEVAGKDISISNTGIMDLEISIPLTSTNFDLSLAVDSVASDNGDFSLASGSTAILTVTPKQELEVGQYSEELNIDINNSTETVALSFEVKDKEIGSGSVTMEDYYYGEEASTPVVTSDTNGTINVTIKYKAKGADDSTYTTEAPTEVGEYVVQAIFAQTDTYKEVEATAEFSVAYGVAPETPYTVEGTEGENGYYTSDVTLIPAVGYLISTQLGGSYEASVDYDETVEYIYLKDETTGAMTDAIGVVAILIDKTEPEISGVLDGDTYFEESIEVIVQDDNLYEVLLDGEAQEIIGNSMTITVSYDEETPEHSITVKDIAGHEKKVTFTLTKDTGVGSVTMEDYYYGEEASTPVVTSDTNGTTNVTIKYKAKGADDSTYTTEAPTEVGEYVVQAIFAQTDTYKEVEATAEFSVAYGVAPETPYTVEGTEGENGYYTSDVTLIPAVGYLISTQLGGSYEASVDYDETVEYIYLKDETTGAMTDAIGIVAILIDKAGPVVEGVVDGETYDEKVSVTVTDDKLSSVTLNGVAVTITDGKASFDVEYSADVSEYTLIAIDEAGHTNKVTFVVETTEEETTEEETTEGETTEEETTEEETTEGETTEEETTEEETTEGETTEEETTEEETTEEETTEEETTEEETTEEDTNSVRLIIVVGSVRLLAGTAYYFGEGNWTVDGDSTVYTGGSAFYVPKDGTYTFSNQ